jgi:hemolysin III
MPPDPIHPLVFRHPVSAGLHLLYAAWALYALALLRRLTRYDRARRAAVTYFGVSLVLLYVASGLYHAVPASAPRLVEFFRLLDLSMIHVLIAGTCTAAFALLRGRLRALLLVLVWLVAGVGVLSKWLLPLPPPPLTIGLFAVAALLGMLPLAQVGRAAGWRGVAWLVGGGLAYAAGATCEALRWPVVWPGVVGPHEVLHLGDVVGSTMHVVFVLRYVAPSAPLGQSALGT